ncbi:hypothetical protein MPTK1_6g15530 [Marchantia polymorpha subsp. ruderalis]|uniref:Uncharacterized protein n=2 Tax=Marchantia polymorpha TaxID=3197 RepID=A0AAF6BSD5_MARPO|nr:hypothetical protein MARPO_0056s0065 [Marchantia polymorpha]BBN14919.1 hypothetical protein Mp_6g15530 [Marchantia polymorpha subsp. ruderalis]|eukprot:PTQ37603.1 hypothetical protein MARPO_0056s0065 [Marchantia polymorpha]
MTVAVRDRGTRRARLAPRIRRPRPGPGPRRSTSGRRGRSRPIALEQEGRAGRRPRPPSGRAPRGREGVPRRRRRRRARSGPARRGGGPRPSLRRAVHGHAVEVEVRQREGPVRSERVHEVEGAPVVGVRALGRDVSLFPSIVLSVRVNEFRDRDLQMPGHIGVRPPIVVVPVRRAVGPPVVLRRDVRRRPVEARHGAVLPRVRGHRRHRRVRDVRGRVAVPGIRLLDPLPPPLHLLPPLLPLVPEHLRSPSASARAQFDRDRSASSDSRRAMVACVEKLSGTRISNFEFRSRLLRDDLLPRFRASNSDVFHVGPDFESLDRSKGEGV